MRATDTISQDEIDRIMLQRYLDDEHRILNPMRRDLAPERGDIGFTEVYVRGINAAARTVDAVFSTPNVDRFNEIVQPQAFADGGTDAFLRNPVFVAQHTYASPDGSPTTIGTVVDLRITDEGLVGTVHFMTDDDLAERWWNRFKQRVVRAFSIGFIAGKWEMQDVTLPDGTTDRVRTFTQAELLEVSAVTIGANRQALARVAGLAGAALGLDDDATADPLPGVSNRRANKVIARSVGPTVQREIRSALSANPGSALCTLIQDVIEMTIDSLHERGRLTGCGHSSGVDDAPPADPYGEADEPDSPTRDLEAVLDDAGY